MVSGKRERKEKSCSYKTSEKHGGPSRNHIFEELSAHIFQSSLHAGQGGDRIDVIFDVYRDQSIKSTERVSRGQQEGVPYIQDDQSGSQDEKKWRRLLS